jgi:head-tail adaptor
VDGRRDGLGLDSIGGMREQVRFGIPSAEGQSVITIRYRTDVRANYRLVDQSVSPERSFQILGYSDPDGDLEQLDLLVVEKL